MKRKTYPLCALLLTVSLASCAPTVTGPAGSYRPNVVSGWAYTFATKIPAAQITEATPEATYATFGDCSLIAVSVGDVRKLGFGAADQVCRDTGRNVLSFLGAAYAVGAVAGAVAVGFFIWFLQAFKQAFAGPSSGAP